MRAFTLVETVVAISVTLVVALALNTLIVNFYRTNAYLLQQTSAVDSAHNGLEVSFQDLREASYGDDGSYPVQSAATSSVTFFSDTDGSGSVEKIHIYLLNNTLYRGVTISTSSPPTYAGQPESTTTIATFVRNGTTSPVFTYYDTNGAVLASSTTDVSKIASVLIRVMVDINPYRAPDILTLTGSATLRNLR